MAEVGSGRTSALTRPLRPSSRSSLNSPASSMLVQGAGQFLPCTLSLLSGSFLESSDITRASAEASVVTSATEDTNISGNSVGAGLDSEAGASLSAKLSLERKKELLRHEILQNIILILNSHSHPRLADLKGDPSLAFSVLGMGLADFCGHSYASLSLSQLQQRIKEQIVYFEPRLDPDSVQILLLTDPLSSVTERSSHTINLEISAKIHPRLLAGQVFRCSTVLDLESGANVVHLKSGRGQD